jgi:hypothetical protein
LGMIMIPFYRRLPRLVDDVNLRLHLRIRPNNAQALTLNLRAVATTRVGDIRPACSLRGASSRRSPATSTRSSRNARSTPVICSPAPRVRPLTNSGFILRCDLPRKMQLPWWSRLRRVRRSHPRQRTSLPRGTRGGQLQTESRVAGARTRQVR